MEVKPGYKLTDIGIVPEEWWVKPLGAFLKICHGKSQHAVEAADGPYPILATGGQIGSASMPLWEKPSVLIGRKGTINKPQYMDIPFWTVDTLFYSELKGSNNALFFFYLFCTIDWIKYNEASGVPSLNARTIESIRIAVPEPSEQRTISAALCDVDILLESIDRLIAKKRDLKKAAMQQLLTGQTRLPGFSGDWEVRPLLSMINIAQGQVSPLDAPYKSMWLIGPEHVEPETGVLKEKRSASEQQAISGKYIFKKGDVVYGKINPYLKKAFYADFDGLCSADMYPLRAVDGVSSKFILYIILGAEFSKYAESVSMRSGIPKINRGELEGFSTSVPKSIAEQAAIASFLSDLDAELAEIQVRRVKTAALKQGMMQELLTGRTRLV